jgi:hypothetical protein
MHRLLLLLSDDEALLPSAGSKSIKSIHAGGSSGAKPKAELVPLALPKRKKVRVALKDFFM